jgi:hypothetical protein
VFGIINIFINNYEDGNKKINKYQKFYHQTISSDKIQTVVIQITDFLIKIIKNEIDKIEKNI